MRVGTFSTFKMGSRVVQVEQGTRTSYAFTSILSHILLIDWLELLFNIVYSIFYCFYDASLVCLLLWGDVVTVRLCIALLGSGFLGCMCALLLSRIYYLIHTRSINCTRVQLGVAESTTILYAHQTCKHKQTTAQKQAKTRQKDARGTHAQTFIDLWI